MHYPVDEPIEIPVSSHPAIPTPSAWGHPISYNFVSESTASRLELRAGEEQSILLRGPRNFSKADVNRLRTVLEPIGANVRTGKDFFNSAFGPRPGADDLAPIRFFVIGVGICISLAVLLMTASRIARERPGGVDGGYDGTSVTASIGACLIAAIAGLLSIPAGLVPVAIGQAVRNNPGPFVVPWGFAVIVTIALPIAMTAIAAALSWRPARGARLQPTA